MEKWKKNDELTLLIDDMGTQGEGIGHIDGYALFVKGAITGEKVRVRLMKLNKNYGFARLLEVLEPSPFRKEPECGCAGACGGCSLQHMTYEGQLVFKEKKVRDCLTRLGGVNLDGIEWLPVIGMNGEGAAANPWHYRNKAQFPVRENDEGKAVTGFFAGRSHRIIEASSCAIQHPVINEVTAMVVAFLREYDISVYNEEKHRGLVRHIYIRRGYYTGQIMVCLVINGTSLPHAEELVRRLRMVDGMTSICLNINRKKTNVILGGEMAFLWGDSCIEDTIGDIRYRISPQSFYQVNPVQTQRLYETALSFAGLHGDETVFDLYCGIGTISLYLAKRLLPEKGGRVIGVEIVPEAVENAKTNADINRISHAQFYCGAAETVVPKILSAGMENGGSGNCTLNNDGATVAPSGGTLPRADLVVVDPPRKGCDAGLLDTIVQMSPQKIVYVSCDPATLARDVKILGEKGYEVKKVQVCDQFCQGWHVECVTLLQRKDT